RSCRLRQLRGVELLPGVTQLGEEMRDAVVAVGVQFGGRVVEVRRAEEVDRAQSHGDVAAFARVQRAVEFVDHRPRAANALAGDAVPPGPQCGRRLAQITDRAVVE